MQASRWWLSRQRKSVSKANISFSPRPCNSTPSCLRRTHWAYGVDVAGEARASPFIRDGTRGGVETLTLPAVLDEPHGLCPLARSRRRVRRRSDGAQYGGKVAKAVSGKTTYLLLGTELDDGRRPEEGRCGQWLSGVHTSNRRRVSILWRGRDLPPPEEMIVSIAAARMARARDAPLERARPRVSHLMDDGLL